jgi:hypothetical protein
MDTLPSAANMIVSCCSVKYQNELIPSADALQSFLHAGAVCALIDPCTAKLKSQVKAESASAST